MADLIARAEMVVTVRHAKGWTQARLAEAAGLSQGYVSKIEAGDAELHGAALHAVADALGCLPELLAYNQPLEEVSITCLHAPSARRPLEARCDRPNIAGADTAINDTMTSTE